MEKEKKGLFGRLLDFWKEKISIGEPNGIRFWNETETAEDHFAEMGAVASLTQEEMKRNFWEETAEAVQEESERQIFFVEETERKRTLETEDIEPNEKRMVSKMFATEVFWNGEQETEEAEHGVGKTFLWEMPEEEKMVRNIIPVAEKVEQEEIAERETLQEFQSEELPGKESKQPDPQIDIEKLMRQMTKKLWEERESCGRRLR